MNDKTELEFQREPCRVRSSAQGNDPRNRRKGITEECEHRCGKNEVGIVEGGEGSRRRIQGERVTREHITDNKQGQHKDKKKIQPIIHNSVALIHE